MRIARRKHLILLMLVSLFAGVQACSQRSRIDLYDIELNQRGTGIAFLYALAYGEQEFASSLLTNDTQLAVAKYCENGEMKGCFTSINLDWNKFESVVLWPQFPNGPSFTYYTYQMTGDMGDL